MTMKSFRRGKTANKRSHRKNNNIIYDKNKNGHDNNASIMRKKKLLDRRIFVCRFLSDKGGNRIRAPPGLEFEFKIKFQIKEDKTAKYAPKYLF